MVKFILVKYRKFQKILWKYEFFILTPRKMIFKKPNFEGFCGTNIFSTI